jgi:hypothetical protein
MQPNPEQFENLIHLNPSWKNKIVLVDSTHNSAIMPTDKERIKRVIFIW